MTKAAFLTVTDHDYFPGTLAVVNSIIRFHPDRDILVVDSRDRPLSPAQAAILGAHPRLKLFDHRHFQRQGRHIGAWELKAYACHDLCEPYDVIIGIDSDSLLCSNVDGEIEACRQSGGFLGGRDGDGPDYDDGYRVYGIETPVRNGKYMSTSLYFCAVTPENRKHLQRWVECSGRAEYNGTGDHPGHGDQGLLNAILFAADRSAGVTLLPNELWSQHWVFWRSRVTLVNGVFWNRFRGRQRQRAFHCADAAKFWRREHALRVLEDRDSGWPYAWFLAMLWLGECSPAGYAPGEWLGEESRHLVMDLFNLRDMVAQVHGDNAARLRAYEEAFGSVPARAVAD